MGRGGRKASQLDEDPLPSPVGGTSVASLFPGAISTLEPGLHPDSAIQPAQPLFSQLQDPLYAKLWGSPGSFEVVSGQSRLCLV